MSTTRPTRVRSVQPVTGFVVRLGFTDGSTRDVDLGSYLTGPIFEPIRTDPVQFRAVTVDPQAGTIVWPNGADIDPDVLYYGLEPARSAGSVNAWIDDEGVSSPSLEDHSASSPRTFPEEVPFQIPARPATRTGD